MSTRYNFFGGLVTDGLILNLDAAKLQSYSGSGTNWVNLINNSISGGTLTNGPTLTGSGKNLAISFDGTNDYVEIPDNNIIDFGISNFTSNIWIYPNSSLTSNTEFGVINKNNGFQNSTGWGLELSTYTVTSPYQKLRLEGFNSGQSSWENSNVVGFVGTNTWSNVNLVRTGNKFELYINGSLSGTKINSDVGLNVDNSVNLTFGKSSTWQSYFKGNISNFNLFNRALSPFDIFQNFNAYKSRYDIPDIVTSGLTLNLDAGNPYSYSPLNTGSTTWTDVSGFGYNGTLTNGASYSNGSIVFDGVDDYVAEPHTSLLDLGTQFSLSSFVKLSNTSSSIQPIFGNVDVDLGIRTRGFTVYWHKTDNYGIGANTIRFQFGQNNWEWNVYGSNANAIVDTNWHHIVLTATNLNTNNPTISFYVDGTNIGSTFWNQSSKAAILYSQNTGSTRVGSVYYPSNPSYDGPYFLAGNISTTQIYNRALSQAEITQNFNALRGRYGI